MDFLKKTIVRALRGLFALAGLSVTRDRPVRNRMKLLSLKLRELGIGTVLDVGANRGQFAMELRACGYSGAIVSFEPLSAAHPLLAAEAAKDGAWLAMPRMALGAQTGNSRINIAQNLDSSSLLAVLQTSIDAAAESGYVGSEDIDVRCLDDVVEAGWKRPFAFAIKLDTQGFELHVLKGAEKALLETTLIVTELSLAPLYEQGARMSDVFHWLEARDFRCIGLMEGFIDTCRNELLHVDGIFVRSA
jgi:FkbM family methyltransferase